MNTKLEQRQDVTAAGRKARSLTLVATLLLVAGASAPVWAGGQAETADVYGQGPAGPLVAAGGAKLVRFSDKLIVNLRMPTPVPGTYNYPPGNDWNNDAYPGKPEAFSMWVFVFNDPASCTGGGPGICTPADARNGTPGAGAFNTAGHLVAGPVLQLSGSINLDSTPFGGAALTDPLTAEVHFAIAPHGALQPETLPNQFSTPIGNPGYWWVALFQAN